MCSIFRERLRPAVVDETQDEEEEAAAAGAERSISLFGLMKDGRLSRSAAATLFYQVCGERVASTWQHQLCNGFPSR